MPNDTASALEALDRLVGRWTTEATHPSLPGVVVHGTADIEWLEGRRFLIHRARSEHPEFPDSISVLGFTEQDRVDPHASGGTTNPATSSLHMHYYDSRGVYRTYDARIDDKAFQLERLAEGFSQRFTGTFADSHDTIVGLWKMRRDDGQWDDDLKITYRRRG